jgi:transposase
MHSTQNERINQITSSTLIVGVDIAKFKHGQSTRFRGVEIGKPIMFETTRRFRIIRELVSADLMEQGFHDAIVGMEPTGHYWLNLALS